jgi:hypothetical protein
LTPDDERRPDERPAVEADGEESGDGSTGDDLESLAVALPSPAGEAQDADDEFDVGALAALGRQRPSVVDSEDGETRLDLAGREPASRSQPPPPTPVSEHASTSSLSVTDGPLVLAADVRRGAGEPRAARARAGWVVPLLVGLGVGAGAAAAVFVAAGDRSGAGAAVAPGPTGTGAEQRAAVEPVSMANSAAPDPTSAAAQVKAVESPAGPSEAAEDATFAARTTPGSAAPIAAGSALEPRKAVAAGAGRAVPAQQGGVPAAPARVDGPPTVAAPAAQPPQASAQGSAKLPGEDDANAKAAPGSVDALLDEALAPGARRQEVARAQRAALDQNDLPLALSREDVTQAMTVLLPAIRGCAMGQSGLATAGIVVRGDGRVASVEVSGAPFAGSASGRCMEGVIRRARFSPFKQPTIRIKFPLAIQ